MVVPEREAPVTKIIGDSVTLREESASRFGGDGEGLSGAALGTAGISGRGTEESS
jgi:hypothetical protein